MAETDRVVLLSGKYEVPWPYKVVTHGGIHPATKYKKTFKIAGIMMIVLGLLSIVMSIPVSAETLRVSERTLMYSGAGYWAGGTFLVTGIVVFVCGRYNVMRCTLTLAFVFSTFTMVGTGFVCYLSFTNAVMYGLAGYTVATAKNGMTVQIL